MVDSVAARVAVTANDAQVGVNRVEPIQLSQVGRAPCELAFADIWRVGHGDQYLFGGFGDLLLRGRQQRHVGLQVQRGTADGVVGTEHRLDHGPCKQGQKGRKQQQHKP